MNKGGKTSNAVVVFGVVIAIALVVIAFMYATSQTALGEDETQVTSCGDSTGKLTINGYSLLNPGSNVTPTVTAGVDGGIVSTSVTSGTTTFPVGAKVKILASVADYLDKSFEFTMPCGGKVLDVPLYYSTSDNPSVRIKNDDGDYVTDAVAGGAINQTNLNVGESLSLDIELQGTVYESSGDLIAVIEFPASTSANITSVQLSGATATAVPSVHTTLNAGSKVVAFKVPAVVGSSKSVHTLTVNLGAAKDLSGGVYTDWYSEQEFIDTDGTIKSGIENADGTAKYENTLDFDFYINAA